MILRGYDNLTRGDLGGIWGTLVFLLPLMIIPTYPSNILRGGKKKLRKEERLIAERTQVGFEKRKRSSVALRGKVTIVPTNLRWTGRSLAETERAFNARAMREGGQRTELLLRQAAERMEAAEVALGAQFQNGDCCRRQMRTRKRKAETRKTPYCAVQWHTIV
jgi:hypothetical protein